MSHESYCQVCAIHEEEMAEVSMRTKYACMTVAAISFVMGLILELSRFEYIIYLTFYIITILAAGRWTIPNGLRGVMKVHLDINFLMTFAAFGAIIIGSPFEGAMVIFLFNIAELLEEHANMRVEKEVQSLFEIKPTTTTLLIDGKEVCVNLEDVDIGQIAVIRPGERIAVDGVIVKGSSAIDESTITGESVPVEKTVGDEVYAGTMNQNGYLEVQVTKRSADSVISKVIEYVEEARMKKAPTEKVVARFSHVYTPMVVVGAILLSLSVFLLGSSPHDALYRGLTLLVVACPCAFAISIPVTMVSAITGFMRNGVLVKGTQFVESASKSKIVAFDKTGTITEGELEVKEIEVHSNIPQEEVFSALYSLELMSEHPISQAIVQAIQDRAVQKEVTDFEIIPGMGLTGVVDGEPYTIGNRKLMVVNDIKIIEKPEDKDEFGTRVFMARGKEHLATIVLGDQIRETSKRAIDHLQALGVSTVMLTGDNRATAKAIGSQLGIDQIHYELLPKDKVRILKGLETTGKIMFVGDGVNDAPALAASDVGIAIAAISSDVAIETADVALMDSDLTKIARLIRHSKHAMRVVKQNVAAAIGIKVLLGFFAVLGLVPLWLAVGIGDMGVSLLVIANALRLAV